MKKIKVINDPEIKALESLVEVETGDGKRFSSFSDILQQIPPLEVKKERVASKFLDLCGPVLGKRKSLALKKRIEAMDSFRTWRIWRRVSYDHCARQDTEASLPSIHQDRGARNGRARADY